MGAPQVPVRHRYSATSPLTIPDGDGTTGGLFVIIDSIDVSYVSDATINRSVSVKVVAGGGTIAQWDAQVNATAAATNGYMHLPFPTGFPVVGSDGNPLATISVTVTGTGVTVNAVSVDYHCRRFNG